MSDLRPQCSACPWLDPISEVPAEIRAHAAEHPDGFVCHTRCGPCDGPRHALVHSAGDPS